MSLENGWKAVSSFLQVVRARLERVTKGPSVAWVWRSGARGSILVRMRVPTQAPGGSAKRSRGADEALGPAAPSRAVCTA
jgi:hypothetical protein